MTAPFSIGTGQPGYTPLPPAPNMPTSPFTQDGIYSPPQPTVGLGARLFGGADPLAGGYFDPNRASHQGAQALRDAGLAILDASAPHPFKPQLGQIIAAGLRGGQQSFQGQQATAYQTDAVAHQQQLQQARASILQKYQGKSDLQSQQAMLSDLLSIGDTQGARALAGYLANAVNEQGKGGAGAAKPNLSFHEQNDADGKQYIVGVDPHTGAIVSKVEAGMKPTTSADAVADRFGSREQRMVGATARTEFRNDTHLENEVATSYGALRQAYKNSSNPASQFAMLDAFIRINNPGGIARQGTLDYVKEIGSLPQRIQSAATQLYHGTASKEIINAVYDMGKAVAASRRISYYNKREATKQFGTQNGIDLEKLLPDDYKHYKELESYDDDGEPGATAPAGSAADRVRKLIGTP